MISTIDVVHLLMAGTLMLERQTDRSVLKVEMFKYRTASLAGGKQRRHLTVHIDAVAEGGLLFAETFHSQSSDKDGLEMVAYVRAAEFIVEQIQTGFQIVETFFSRAVPVANRRTGVEV